ncbi:DUF3999 domain-containing protein [Edaphobacter bradus]|uniref:DUF3999 domain-containing protein n=1 Tax=Edaphobacter bradus TaxID=2259016 RepID=UPI0021E0D171|nr:DUF3999 domain-containing protein [Edaphobacter bradus]
MKIFPVLALLLWQAVAPVASVQTADRQYLRYQRMIAVPGAGQSCAVLDAATFAHAAASLKDLRVYAASAGPREREIPYAITLSEPVQPDSETATVMNLGQRGQGIVFDLVMPERPYTDVALDLAGQDFLATAVVSGSNAANSSSLTRLGEFTLFDLRSQHLSRSTTLQLQESSFPYLHVELTASPASGAHPFTATPQMVRGATVPPSREAQSLFALSAETHSVTQRGRQTIAKLALPERVPVERVSFELAPEFKANFSRDVVVSDRPEGTPETASERIAGTILRVRLNQGGREIRQQQLSVPATLGSNLQGPGSVEVTVNNGDDAPLPITAVRLEMRERELCFDAPAAGNYLLFYGDPALVAPEYDYARIFSPSGAAHAVTLGPETANRAFHTRPDTRAITERHPELLWVGLLAVICVLALVALRSSKHLHHHH